MRIYGVEFLCLAIVGLSVACTKSNSATEAALEANVCAKINEAYPPYFEAAFSSIDDCKTLVGNVIDGVTAAYRIYEIAVVDFQSDGGAQPILTCLDDFVGTLDGGVSLSALTAESIPLSCYAILSPRKEGEPCAYDGFISGAGLSICDKGLECQSSADAGDSSSGTCAIVEKKSCEFTSDGCGPKKSADGASCTSDDECNFPNWLCVATQDSSAKCTEVTSVGVGGDCSGRTKLCSAASFCNGQTCIARISNGSPCTASDAGVACEGFGACIDGVCKSNVGLAQIVEALVSALRIASPKRSDQMDSGDTAQQPRQFSLLRHGATRSKKMLQGNASQGANAPQRPVDDNRRERGDVKWFRKLMGGSPKR